MEIKKEDIKIGYCFCYYGKEIYEVVAIFQDDGETLYVAKTLECFGTYSYSIF